MDTYILNTLINTFHYNAKISKSAIIKNVMERRKRMRDIRIADIIPNGSDMCICSIADIPESGVIGLRRAE